jgi:hypothetical protein
VPHPAPRIWLQAGIYEPKVYSDGIAWYGNLFIFEEPHNLNVAICLIQIGRLLWILNYQLLPGIILSTWFHLLGHSIPGTASRRLQLKILDTTGSLQQ